MTIFYHVMSRFYHSIETASLIIADISYAFAYRCGMLNIGIEGQMLAGAILSTWVGINITFLPGVLHLFIAVTAGILAGTFLGCFIAYLKIASVQTKS